MDGRRIWRKEAYMELLINEMIPEIGAKGLAEACDIWCDEGHYEKEECRKILEAGREHGMEPKIHAGAYSYVEERILQEDNEYVFR